LYRTENAQENGARLSFAKTMSRRLRSFERPDNEFVLAHDTIYQPLFVRR
jgi:hypothetical protein